MTPAALFLAATLGGAVAGIEKPEDDLSLPPLALARGLPSHERCLEAIAEIGRWQARDPEGEARWELWRRRGFWERAAAATNLRGTWEGRRRSLAALIEEVGWPAVFTGQLPPPIPLEWFLEIP